MLDLTKTVSGWKSVIRRAGEISHNGVIESLALVGNTEADFDRIEFDLQSDTSIRIRRFRLVTRRPRHVFVTGVFQWSRVGFKVPMKVSIQ
jgi:hypothetical protein